MKKIVTLMMVLVMVVALAVPALATEGVTSAEQDLYDHFCKVVNEWVAKKSEYAGRANEYKNLALQTLIQADLSASACADLDSTIDAVAGDLTAANPTTVEEMKAILPSIVEKVNTTSRKYDIVVAVSTSTAASTIYLNGKQVVVPAGGPAPIKDSSSGKDNTKPSSPIVQTGFDMTGTIVVAVVLAIALLGSAVIISKKRLAANN